MKIALVTFLFDPFIGGGAALSAKLLADGFANDGHEVIVITTHKKNSITCENLGNIKIYRFFPYNLYWIAEKNKQKIWKKMVWQFIDIWNPHSFHIISQILKKEKPDIVHVNKLRGISPSVWSASKKTSKYRPVIQTCRDYEIMSPEGTLSGKIGYLAENRKLIMRPYQALRSYLSYSVDGMTSLSQYTMSIIEKCNIFPYSIRKVIPNTHGVSVEDLEKRIQEKKANSTDKKIRLLYLGRLHRDKGIEWLCSLFHDHLKEFPKFHLDIGGVGPLDKVLREKYSRNKQIQFHGFVTGLQKEKLYRICHVAIVPSLCPEVLGNVNIEAPTFGKPVIASQIGGIPEVLEQGKTGFLYPPQDTNSLLKIFHKIHKDSSILQQMRENCFKVAFKYTPKTILKKYYSLYKHLV